MIMSVKQLAGPADERLALAIFVGPGASPTNISRVSCEPVPKTV